jgi:hypothetical protein
MEPSSSRTTVLVQYNGDMDPPNQIYIFISGIGKVNKPQDDSTIAVALRTGDSRPYEIIVISRIVRSMRRTSDGICHFHSITSASSTLLTTIRKLRNDDMSSVCR